MIRIIFRRGYTNNNSFLHRNEIITFKTKLANLRLFIIQTYNYNNLYYKYAGTSLFMYKLAGISITVCNDFVNTGKREKAEPSFLRGRPAPVEFSRFSPFSVPCKISRKTGR